MFLQKYNSNNFYNDTMENLIDTFFPKTSLIRAYDFYDVNKKEEDKQIIFAIDMPGTNKEDIKLVAKNRMISLEWKKKVFDKETVSKKAFAIPDNLDVDKISANLKDGVLYVSVGKKLEEQDKTIQIT